MILAICGYFSADSQSINTEFGKNRVQFHDDFNNWWQYESDNFITYWYGKGRLIALPVIQMAEQDHDQIQKVMEHRMNDKIEIIVYVDIADVKQSNIGTEETFISKAGETKIVGNKMFVYFDGNHENLRLKIREGIATVFINNMLFGENIQEIIQNAVLMNVTDWYKLGLVAYAASPWNMLVEDELRDLWNDDNKNKKFDKFSTLHPKIAGHSFWFFIDQTYGKTAISNLLYLTKISRSTDNSFEYILNTPLELLKSEWEGFYDQYYENEKGRIQAKPKDVAIKLANKKFVPISSIKLSPNGKMLAYVHNNLGKYRVVVRDLATNEEKVIFKFGYKNVFQETDYNYPILAWNPTKPEITILYESKDVIKLRRYRLDTKEKVEQTLPTDLQRIYTLSAINDLDYVMSATLDGFSDLFLYKSKNRNYFRLTNDIYDDLDAEYITYKGTKGILFSSNRLTDTIKNIRFDTLLPSRKFELFFLADEAKVATKLTNSGIGNKRYPYLTGQNKIAYLSDASGIINTYALDILSGQSIALSNLDRNIIRHHALPNSDVYITTYYNDGQYQFYKEKINPNLAVTPFKTQLIKDQDTENKKDKKQPLILETGIIPDEIPSEFLFQSEFSDPETLKPINIGNTQNPLLPLYKLNLDNTQKSKKPIEPFINTRAVAANNKFALSEVTTKLDNDLLFEGLESYTGNRQQLLTNPMGILFKGKIQDLFEDYAVTAGVRIPTTFNGSEYFLVFDNKKSRIDKRFALYRRSNKYNNETMTGPQMRSKKTSMLGMYQMRYPFDIYRSVRATSTFRVDRFLDLSTENVSFQKPAINQERLSLRLEYIYDNTHQQSLNITHGTRYKVYFEAINEFDIQVIDGFRFDASKGYTGIVGFDARHYIPILKNAIIALRASGATSFGSQQMLYYLGGMENWLFPKFDQSIPEPQDGNFAYKANVFQMRGFDNNIRNGASFLVSNAELRVPIMSYILGRNCGNAFFRNFQLTGFFDAGLAWHGGSPYSAKNPLNQVEVVAPPLIRLDIEYFRDPLVMGYGFGARTQILGYFVKADYAWGIETKIVQPPKLYLTFGLDF